MIRSVILLVIFALHALAFRFPSSTHSIVPTASLKRRGLWSSFKRKANKVKKSVTEAANTVSRKVSKKAETIKRKVNNSKVAKAVNTAKNSKVGKAIGKGISVAHKARKTVADVAAGIGEGAGDSIKALGAAVINPVNTASAIKKMSTAAVDKAKAFTKDVERNGLKNTVRATADKAVKSMKNACAGQSKAKCLGKAIGGGGIGKLAQAVNKEAVKQAEKHGDTDNALQVCPERLFNVIISDLVKASFLQVQTLLVPPSRRQQTYFKIQRQARKVSSRASLAPYATP